MALVFMVLSTAGRWKWLLLSHCVNIMKFVIMVLYQKGRNSTSIFLFCMGAVCTFCTISLSDILCSTIDANWLVA